jgi:hypothetical protein
MYMHRGRFIFLLSYAKVSYSGVIGYDEELATLPESILFEDDRPENVTGLRFWVPFSVAIRTVQI